MPRCRWILPIFFLAPLLAEFARRYPGISFEFDLTPHRVDLVTEPVDVAIRMGEPPSSSLIARQLAGSPRYLYASPRYIELSGEPGKPADLSRYECLRLSPAEVNGWILQTEKETAEVAVGGRFLLKRGHDPATRDARSRHRCAAGRNRGPRRRHRAVASGDARMASPPIPVYAITETRLLPAKTQRFIEFLRKHLEE
jgi:DNA-binding transcriptional LysR family regulator